MSARRSSSLFLAFALPAALSSGCATGKSTQPGGNDQPDASSGGGGFVDAAPRADAAPQPPDAAPQGGAVTLSQSSSMDVIGQNSVACPAVDPVFGVVLGTADNSYYRVFDLAAAGVTGDLTISSVTVGVEDAESGGGGGQPAGVKLYTLNGNFTLGNLTQLASANVTVQDVAAPAQGTTGGQLIDFPISATAPAGSQLVVEFHSPDGGNDGNFLYVGSNTAAQTGPTYVRAANCSVNQPTDAASGAVGAPDMHWVVTVTGQD
jgi:hypothetical protein